MTEYMIKVRADDPNGVGRDAVREGMQQLIDEVNGHAPFYFTIDQVDNAIPKSVDDILLSGICPNCKNESLYEDERSEEHISFLCDKCDHGIYVGRDDMGISLVVMTWFDETKPMFEDEMEKVIYDRLDR